MINTIRTKLIYRINKNNNQLFAGDKDENIGGLFLDAENLSASFDFDEKPDDCNSSCEIGYRLNSSVSCKLSLSSKHFL